MCEIFRKNVKDVIIIKHLNLMTICLRAYVSHSRSIIFLLKYEEIFKQIHRRMHLFVFIHTRFNISKCNVSYTCYLIYVVATSGSDFETYSILLQLKNKTRLLLWWTSTSLFQSTHLERSGERNRFDLVYFYDNSNIFKWQQQDSNPQPLSSLTKTRPFG